MRHDAIGVHRAKDTPTSPWVACALTAARTHGMVLALPAARHQAQWIGTLLPPPEPWWMKLVSWFKLMNSVRPPG